ARDAALAEIGLPVPESIEPAWLERALNQLGTLGSGNHFLEVQADEVGRVFVMLHSGSRSLGKTICDAFHKRALHENRLWHSELPDPELAYFPVDTDGHAGYWAAMRFALRFAEVNRSRMLDQVEASFLMHTRLGSFTRLIDVHHNYAAWENHFGQNGIVHRKGAVRARVGETVLIPGSMGTASYVAEGLGNADSFQTCQHGAGRAMSRTAARKAMTSRQLFDEMARLGVMLHSGDPKTAAEEAPMAYKDIETVMAASTDLIRPTKRLTPLGVVKG
ncbi:MAG: RtcB family protein, partial [Chloroflexota bacterium]|nr:RtcB family protein [Chloroflexota bacterium]